MKYLILGAGPAGLTVANILRQRGCDDFLVLEKEKTAGGLCRSVEVDGAPFDIGGGHFLDVRRPEVNKFLFSFLPEAEWDLYRRNTIISIQGQEIGQPIESHIWQMSQENQVAYLKSIAIAGCNLGKPMPERFVDWIYWKLGRRIAEDYMLPYNQKMFGSELNALGTYWLAKLPNVSFDETLLSCLNRRAYGKDPGHTQFYYPKAYGYGELWLRMAERIRGKIIYEAAVKSLDFCQHTVTTADGSSYTAETIITTVPWAEWQTLAGMPEEIWKSIGRLKHSSIQTTYHPEHLATEAQWIYCPDEDVAHHRILVRENFCPGSRGYWTETNAERLGMEAPSEAFHYLNAYAYPLNTIEKPQIMERLLGWCKEHGVIGLGRWGEHRHYNSDATVELAMRLGESL